MGYPVVHFELHGTDAGRLNGFYADVFGWEIDAENPMNYGRVDTKSGTGIAGGITASDMAPAVLVYIQVPDAQAALDKVQAAGGKVIIEAARGDAKNSKADSSAEDKSGESDAGA